MENLRSLIRNLIAEINRSTTKISASQEYMKKEDIKNVLQSFLEQRVTSGEIKDAESLEMFFKDVEMSIKTLKMIPVEVWKSRSQKGIKQ